MINRKNFLFSNTEKGAEATCVLMSAIQTAKTNGLDTYRYLTYLFENLYKFGWDKIVILDDFLPWNEDIQARFKVRDNIR